MPLEEHLLANAETPLAPLNGDRPPAPEWFARTMAIEPARGFVDIEGAQIETLVWGQRGKRGLLFLHGNGAQADWWSFIAPFFADDWRVAAISWSGMGRSDWRDAYDLDQYAREALGCAQALGLHEGEAAPIFVGHSLGAAPTLRCACTDADKIAAVVLVDYGMRPPEWRPRLAGRSEPNKIYPTLEAALARFSLRPPQSSANLFLIDYIARQALRPADPLGVTWRFDPEARNRAGIGLMDYTRAWIGSVRCPITFMWGARSHLMQPDILAMTRAAAPDARYVEIPDAAHHVMLDQPLALVAALRADFAAR